MQSVRLSKGDSKVLAQIFDPESGLARAEVLVDPNRQADRHIQDADLLRELQVAEKKAIQLIENVEKSQDSTPKAKNEAYQMAISIMDQMNAVHPSYASARNNRAQLRRWHFGDRNLICQSRQSKDLERSAAAAATVHDLQQCIALSSPERPQDAVSPVQGRLLAQAYTQLGAMYYAATKDLGSIEDGEIADESFDGWSKDVFEEEASRLFYLGGLHGNEVAKALAVQTNPHAKLCGIIVKQAMRKELALQC